MFFKESEAIAHSPYYGCTIRVISKANVSYEGILDGISQGKDRIYLKNVRVKGNVTNPREFRPQSISSVDHLENSLEELDALNAVMINHLINDTHIYDQVCLNVGDIQELKLLHLPSTFHQSKAKLHAIDPCLVDIRLSSSDQYQSTSPLNVQRHPPPIARRSRRESIGSLGSNPILLSSSNDSSSSLEQQFSRLSTTNHHRQLPVTLVAKKVLPKKNHRPARYEQQSMNNGKSSPIRVTITSKLNPDAAPFYSRTNSNPPLTFYQHQRFVPPRQMNNQTKSFQRMGPPSTNRERLSMNLNDRPRQSTVSLRSTGSLPYQSGSSLMINETLGSGRGPRTVSGTSSGSNLSVDVDLHSLGQYDFEKANEEFRRYLELEELVTRRGSSASIINDIGSNQNSYKKEISFFDRISCTATTGTAVAYTEIDELEKNRQTFGEDALLFLGHDEDF